MKKNVIYWIVAVIVSLPLCAILAYFCAAMCVGDTSDEFTKEFWLWYIPLLIFFIPLGYFSAKYGIGGGSSSGRLYKGGSTKFLKTRIRGYKPTDWKTGENKSLFY